MTDQKGILNRAASILCPRFFVILFVFLGLGMFVRAARAGDPQLDFDSYPVGSICSQTGWACDTGVTAEVNRDVFRTLPNSLKVHTTATNIYAKYTLATSSAYTYYFWVKTETGGSNSACVYFYGNIASTSHTYVCLEQSGKIYVNGSDSGKTYTSGTLTYVGVNIDDAGDQARVNVSGGSWSSYVYRGNTDKTTTAIYFNTNHNEAYFEDLTASFSMADDYGTVQSGTVANPSDAFVQIAEENFSFPKVKYCQFGDTNCDILFYYTYDQIGAAAYLLPTTATSVLSYVDMVSSLGNKMQLKEALHPTVRSASTTDYYKIIISDNGTNTTYSTTTVFWIDANPYDTDADSVYNILDFLSGVFPISIMRQIYVMVSGWLSYTATPVDIKINSLLATQYALPGNPSVLSANLLVTGGWWNNYVYPWFEYGIYFMAFLYVIFRMRSFFATDDEQT